MRFAKNRREGQGVMLQRGISARYKWRYNQIQECWEEHANAQITIPFPIPMYTVGRVVKEDERYTFLLSDSTVSKNSIVVAVTFPGRERPVLVNVRSLRAAKNKRGNQKE